MKCLLFLILLVKSASCGIISSLPGYGSLPFTLETGYVGLENDNQQLFYYFVQSQNSPSTDPILYWISGGPGYSSLWAFFFEFGPLSFNLSYPFDGSMPELLDNKNDWTKFMNILFVDGPVGTGFSYAKTPEGYNTSNLKFATTLNNFIHKWLEDHEDFKSNAIYISGDGFSGNPIAIALNYILDDNAVGREPYVNMKGYILVSPGAHFYLDFNSRIPYANRMGLISDGIFKDADAICNGNFLFPTTEECNQTVNDLNKLIENINLFQILEPLCANTPLPNQPYSQLHRSLQEELASSLDQSSDTDTPRCRKFNHEICNVWANLQEVQEALQVEMGTTFVLYNDSVDHSTYQKDFNFSVVDYHIKLTETNLRGIIMSGDHDMDIPNIATQQWIKLLDLNLIEKWRPWFVDNETAGYTEKFEKEEFSLTYATVKGGGHLTQEYRPKECYHMIYNWTSSLPL